MVVRLRRIRTLLVLESIIPPTHPQMSDLGDTAQPPAKGGGAPF